MTSQKIHVPYIQPPLPALRKIFIRARNEYDGLIFVPVDACKDVPRTPRELEFAFYKLPDDMTHDDTIEQLREQGLRPALYEEGVAFSVAQHRLLCVHRPDLWCITIGSTAMVPVDDTDPVVKRCIDDGDVILQDGSVRCFATMGFSVMPRHAHTGLGLMFDIGFLDEGRTVLAVRE